MITQVRKLTNISKASVPIKLDPTTVVYVGPGQTMENLSMHNLDAVKEHLNVEQDLTEVTPIKEKRQMLND